MEHQISKKVLLTGAGFTKNFGMSRGGMSRGRP